MLAGDRQELGTTARAATAARHQQQGMTFTEMLESKAYSTATAADRHQLHQTMLQMPAATDTASNAAHRRAPRPLPTRVGGPAVSPMKMKRRHPGGGRAAVGRHSLSPIVF